MQVVCMGFAVYSVLPPVILKEWAIPSIGGDKFFIRLTGKT